MEGKPPAAGSRPPADGSPAAPAAGPASGSAAGPSPASSGETGEAVSLDLCPPVGEPLGEAAVARLRALHRLLREKEHLGLTGFRTPEILVERFFHDALALRAILPAAGPFLDIGSGAGTPALPLAAAVETGDWLLLEPRRRAAAFLETAAEAMGLTARVRVCRMHFKEYLNQDDSAAFLGRVTAVTLRAVKLKRIEWQGLATRLGPSAVVLWPTSRAARERADLPRGLFDEEEHPAERGIVWQGRPRGTPATGH